MVRKRGGAEFELPIEHLDIQPEEEGPAATGLPGGSTLVDL